MGNTKRVVPDDREIIINWEAWKRPEIFEMIKAQEVFQKVI
ncbi:MAG: hypothetical protein R2942_17155 [Ignavibacteria bacterium]